MQSAAHKCSIQAQNPFTTWDSFKLHGSIHQILMTGSFCCSLGNDAKHGIQMGQNKARDKCCYKLQHTKMIEASQEKG